MTAMFGWCLDGRHKLRGDGEVVESMNQGRCPGVSSDGRLTCPCACHPAKPTAATS